MELCITHGSIFFEAKTEAALRPGEPSRRGLRL